MSEHAWFTENLAGYVAEGLPAEERGRFEKHAGECRDCAQALAEQRAFDASMAKLFASARPKAGFENRVLIALRAAPLRRRVQWMKTMRWIGSAAAVLLLAVIGYGMHEFAQSGKLPFSGSAPGTRIVEGKVQEAAARVHQQITLDDDSKSMVPDGVQNWADEQTKYRFQVLAKSRDGRLEGKEGFAEPADPLSKAKEDSFSTAQTEAGESDPGKLKGKAGGGAVNGSLPIDGISASLDYGMKDGAEAAQRIEDLKKLHVLRIAETEQERAGQVTTWGALPRSPASAGKPGDPLMGDALGLRQKLTMGHGPGGGAGGGPGFPGGPSRGFAGPGGGFGDRDKDGNKNAPGDPKGGSSSTPSPDQSGIPAEKAPKTSPGQSVPTNGPAPAIPGLMPPGPGESVGGPRRPVIVNSLPELGSLVIPSNKTVEYYHSGAGDPSSKSRGDPKDGKDDNGQSDGKGPGRFNQGYFRDLPGKDLEGDMGKPLSQIAQGKSQEGGAQKSEPKGETPKAPEKKTPDDGIAGKQPPAKTQPAQAPEKAAARKIIRTGEVEFEITAFDDAVAGVTRLITNIPGAFVATVNSEKLPNGKVRGSIIVRMPPDTLDQFLLDMRKELGKTGELKSQRIGSQDVTKAYYDLESRLRAARTMEDRLINIIKSGKGEIKDLLLAEKELGVWRTKIEEMEGEIRYFNNQVSLSTLTITLYEKEIRAAAAMVVTERVNMKIESEDVEQALQSALMTVAEAKGRVIRSDSKLHAAGQYEATLQFEVAPAAAPGVKEKLKKLGIVTHHDAQRLQQAEGGTGTMGTEIKSRQSDVQFSVEFFNVANIQPREAYVLQIITEDVPGDYRKLQEAVTQANGQVRAGNLNEQDKLKISAQFDFDVPATARNVMDKLVTGLGDVLSRNTMRAPAGERATDRKVGFRLTLLNLANIKPRESYVLKVATQDVPAEYRRLQDAIAGAKGQIHAINLNEQDKLNTAAQIDFDVPRAARDTFDKMLAAAGDVLERNTLRAGPTETATDRKSGYRLTLFSLANVAVRESYVVHVATTDVSGDYRKVQDVIGGAKGQIRAINLNEQDKLNTSAQIDFDVPAEDRAKIDGLMKELGEITVRNTLRVPQGQTATSRKVGYQLILRNIASVPPRESYTLQAVSLDVPNGYRKLQEAVAQAKGYVRVGQLNEQDKLNISAQFDFDVPATEKDVIEKLLVEIGDTYSRNTQRVPPNEVATDRKVGYRLTIKSVAGMPPREKVTLDIEVKDVEQAATTFKDMVRAEGGSIVADPINRGANGRVNAMLLFNVPLASKEALVGKFKKQGTVRESKSSTNPQAADTKLATVHIDVILSNEPLIVPSDQGLWPQIRKSLSLSFQFLSLSLTFIVLGLMVVLPWALLLWVAVKLFKRMRAKTQPAAATGA